MRGNSRQRRGVARVDLGVNLFEQIGMLSARGKVALDFFIPRELVMARYVGREFRQLFRRQRIHCPFNLCQTHNSRLANALRKSKCVGKLHSNVLPVTP